MKMTKYALGCLSILAIFALTTVEISAHDWMAPRDAVSLKNPNTTNAESVLKGKQAYLENCATCHGENIEGKKAEDVGLEMDSPNLKVRLKTHTDGDFFWKINEGRGEMPSFKEDLPDQDKWNIINYIRHESK